MASAIENENTVDVTENKQKFHATPPEVRTTKPAVEDDYFEYKNLREDDFWREIPAFADVDRDTFLDHKWQMKHSVYGSDQLIKTVQDIAPQEWLNDAIEGFSKAPMAVRVTPYLLGFIDWSNPYTCLLYTSPSPRD